MLTFVRCFASVCVEENIGGGCPHESGLASVGAEKSEN